MIAKAISQICLNHAFFASILLQRKVTAKDDIKTFCTDGKTIFYNPAFLETLELKEVIFILLHEILHIAFNHFARLKGRDHELFNIAADYVINLILISEKGVKFPQGGLLNYKFANMSAEQVYSYLQNNPSEIPNFDKDNMDIIEPKSDEEAEQIEQEVKQMIAQARTSCKLSGTEIGQTLGKALDNFISSEHNWKEILNDYITQVSRNDYTYSRPNRRSSGAVILPSLYSKEVGKIIFAIDTSGSIDKELLKTFAGEIKDAADYIGATIDIIYCDTDINKIETFEQGEEIEIIEIGGGGTRFSPVFNYLQETDQDEPIECIIYFTDGYCNDFGTEPDAPLIWAIYSHPNFAPPFGEVLHLDK